MSFISVGFQFKCGDLLTVLPGFQAYFRKEGIKFKIYQRVGTVIHNGEWGEQVTMTRETFDMLKPLIEYQEYIESFEIWEGEKVDYDFLKTRDARLIPLPGSDIHHWSFFVFPQLACDLGEDWVKLPENGNKFNDLVISGHVIINRTTRYLNHYVTYYFLKKYEDCIIFAGSEMEHKTFQDEWQIKIPRLIVKDFIELAQAIKHCKFFLGNQSFCWHLADSMHHKRILEVCPQYPNTLPTGKDGYAFLYPQALELYFKQLIL